MSKDKVTRRTVLTAGAAGLASTLLGSQAACFSESEGKRQAKNIIFLVSDGMSCGVPALLDHYLQRTEGKLSYWRQLMNEDDVTNGLQDTRSLSSLVTDSAAASSSWGSGRHIWNGQINTFPDGTVLRTLYDILIEESGMKTGLVTTATVTHATPAGFAIAADRRNDEAGIAEKYLERGVDVILGGGTRFFESSERPDKRDLIAEYVKGKYHFIKSRSEMLSAPKDKKLLGLFSRGHMPYAVDRIHQPELKQTIPSLAEMTATALANLKDVPKGFVLQVEAARVDHAAHGNDFAGLVYDQLDFDDAIKVAVEFARNDGETLVVITSDHANSNPGLIGAGAGYFDSTQGIETLRGMKASYEVLLPKIAVQSSLNKLKDIIEAELGIALKSEDAELAYSAFSKDHALANIEQYRRTSSVLSIVLSNYTHVAWSGRQHANDFTLVSALGPGSQAFSGLIQNTSFFDKLLACKSLAYSNPKMTYQDAAKYAKPKASSLERAIDVHWA